MLENTDVALTLVRLDRLMLATEAGLTRALLEFRMAGFKRPFGNQEIRFYHLFTLGNHLGMCGGLAVTRPERLMSADLARIDCLACLDAFTEHCRPKP